MSEEDKTVDDEETELLLTIRQLKKELANKEEQIRKREEELGTQNELLKSLSSPPLVIAVVSEIFKDTVEVTLKDTKYEVAYHPALKDSLKIGASVALDMNSYAVVKVKDTKKEGPIAVVSEVIDDSRVKINLDGSPVIVQGCKGIKRGDLIVLDKSKSIIVDNLGRQDKSFALEKVPELPWNRIGGLDDVIETIRDVIETPFLHRDLYKKYNKRVEKGVLLYGPPGCGKTLLAKSIAYNLTKSLEEKTGQATSGYFLSMKGPEVLSKFVGVAEETIRLLFASAREKSLENDEPVVIFLDEAESILKRRGSGISTDVYDSIVPQFLAEMDGLEQNNNVIVILATNRADMLDPAVLRPGRIDRKLEIPRPDKKGAHQIYKLYLKDVPLTEEVEKTARKNEISPVDYLALAGCEKMFSDNSIIAKMEFFDGSSEQIRYRNLVSGAVIESSVQRAIDLAIKREINGDAIKGLTIHDLATAIDSEFKELGINVKRLLTETDVHSIAGDKYDQIRDVKQLI